MAPRNKAGSTARREAITLLIEPKLRWGLELLARKHKRSMSSVMEWALLKGINSDDGLLEKVEGDSIFTLSWDVDEADRTIKLAWYAPELLTFEEEVLWKLIRENPYFWSGKQSNFPKSCRNKVSGISLNNLHWPKIREHWNNLKMVATGKASPDILPVQRESAPSY